ncbi:DUF222 domain-containing protein [Corynebacterium sp. NPDC060344]|uniref:HNH endonuclease signature motif containing protein n=1 Tax=Corynebacterium sp. NPDC060344 TaxID=3347101 RepID=UPI0036510247
MNLDELAALMHAAINALLALARTCESTPLSATALLQLAPVVKQLDSARRGMAVLDSRVAETVVSEQLSRILGTTRADDFLVDEYRLSRREASTRVKAATFLGDHPDLKAAAHVALRSGDLTLRGIADVAKEVVSLDDRAERTGADIAAEVIERCPAHGPHGAGALCRKLVKKENRRFPRDPNAAHKERRLTVGKQDGDGGAKVNGYFDAATLALLEAWLLTHGLKKGGHDDGRTPAQRNADALDLALRTAHEAHPRVKGKPMCTVVAALRMDDLAAATGAAPTNGTHPTRTTVKAGSGVDLGLIDLLRLGLSDDMYTAIIDPDAPMTDAKLKLGRTKRSASLEQRIALQLLDGTCQHPGCHRPPDACDVHHLDAWLLGGETDLGNLTLLCRRHHSDNDDTRADPRRGHMTPRHDDPRGRTGWARPVGADGTREVRFNDVGGAEVRENWVDGAGTGGAAA